MIRLKNTLGAYRIARQFWWPLLLIHFCFRSVTVALLTPVFALVLAVALWFAGQPVLTDADILAFFASPIGVAGAVLMLGLWLAVGALDFILMTLALRNRAPNAAQALSLGFGFLAPRMGGLLRFCLWFLLRIFVISAPFLAAMFYVYLTRLTAFDLNYYLTHLPPEAVKAGAMIGALLVAMALVLLYSLAGWGVALHVFLAEDIAPNKAFAMSRTMLKGRRFDLIIHLILWGILRSLRLSIVAFLFGSLAALVLAGVGGTGGDLRAIAQLLMLVLAVWAGVHVAVDAVAKGALCELLLHVYAHSAGGEFITGGPSAPAPQASPEESFQESNVESTVESTAQSADEDTELGADEGADAAQTPLLITKPPAARRPALPWGLVGGTAALAVFAMGYWGSGALLQRVKLNPEVTIIAHRGAAAQRPENTMAAVEKAIEDGADWIEVDVQETAEGTLIIAHDSDFMKLAKDPLKTWQAKRLDLERLDIGSWFAPEYAQERTPMLRDVLLASRGRANLLIELKYYGHDVNLEAAVISLVEELGMADQVAIMSLKYRAILKVSQMRPRWRTGAVLAASVGDVTQLEADFLALNAGQISARVLRAAHAAGQEVYVWTVDDPVQMSRLISMGVDGVITNDPALAKEVLAARRSLSTGERLLLWAADFLDLSPFDLVAEGRDA